MQNHDYSSLSESGVLECPICYEIFNNATETFCGHAFCELCLYRCLEREDICPTCRAKPSPVHPSFTIRRIVDEYRKHNNLTIENINPRTAQEEKDLGNSHYTKGQFALAIKHYSNAIHLSPSSVLFGNRAICLFKLKQYKLALDDCNKSIQMDPNYVKSLARKGLCLEQLRYYEEAKNVLLHCRDLDVKGSFQTEVDGALDRLSKYVKIVKQTRPPVPPSPHNRGRAQDGNVDSPLNLFSQLFGDWTLS